MVSYVLRVDTTPSAIAISRDVVHTCLTPDRHHETGADRVAAATRGARARAAYDPAAVVSAAEVQVPGPRAALGAAGAPSVRGPRVGLLCGNFDPTRDGVADYTRRLAAQLGEAGLDACILTTHEHARAQGGPAAGVTTGWNLPGVLRASRGIAALDLDLVHLQFAPSAFAFRRAVGLLPELLRNGPPIVVTLHEYAVSRPPRLLRPVLGLKAWDWETLRLVPTATRLVVVTDEQAAELVAGSRGAAERVVRMPVGTNVAVSALDRDAARAAVRRRLQAPADAPVVVFFGFLHQKKRLADLVEATAVVRRSYPQVRLVLAGGMESHSVAKEDALSMRRDLERVVAARQLVDAVSFTGFLGEQEVSGLLHGSDVAVLPFPEGGSWKSGSLLAALSHGLPTVVTGPAARGAPDVGDGVLRVAAGDVGALADAVSRVLTDRGLSGRLREGAVAAAGRRSWPDITARHVEMYRDVLASSKHRHLSRRRR